MNSALLAYGGIALVGGALSIVGFALGRNPVSTPPRVGLRGLKRRRAIERGGAFAAMEPALRVVAGLVAHLPIAGARRRIDSQLVRAGDVLGLSPDEHIAMSILSSAGFMAFAVLLRDVIGTNAMTLLFLGGVGAMIPHIRVTGEIQRRGREVNRSLPAAIDLASLCMGAGLDFPGALRQIIDKAVSERDALHEEFERILQFLELGRTRREALESFADRVPTEAVRDFVSSVIQAEEKGNPLSEVLRIQARVLRMRRSLAAEEAASRAGVMMMIPLMLIFASILLILLGPFIIQGMGSGF